MAKIKKAILTRLEAIVSDKGKYVTEFNDSDFNKYVITGLQSGDRTIKNYIGRLVQIRKEIGAFGSDTVFLRHCDNVLCMHENQWFYFVKEEHYKELDEIFKDVHSDNRETPYTMNGEFEEKGFIIPSEIKEGETTPMREIKGRLKEKISEMISKK